MSLPDPQKKPKKPSVSFIQTVRQGWTPYRKLLPFVKPYRRRFILGMICGVLSGVLSGLFGLLMKHVTDYAFHGTMKDPITHKITQVANADTASGFVAIIGMCSLIPIVMIVRSVFDYLEAYCMAWVSMKVLTDLRHKLYETILSQSLDFFNKSRSGMLMSRVANETRAAQAALTGVTTDLVVKPFTVLTAIGVLFHLDWKFTLVSLGLFPLCLAPIMIFGKKARRMGRSEEDTQAGLMVQLQESFAGIRVIKAFSREKHEVRHFFETSRTMFSQGMRVRRSIEIVGPMVEAVSALGAGVALLYVYFNGMSAGTFFGLLTSLFMLYAPMKSLSRVHVMLQKCMAATTNIFDLLETKASVQDKPGAPNLKNVRGEIALEDISFTYKSAKTNCLALRGVSLNIEAGKTYALVGESGSGKSTMLSLLLRFYDPDEGRILIDGKDIRDITQSSLRQAVGIVNQDTFLFHDTVYNNILYGRLDATEAEVYEAARLAYAHDFILAQPNGYQTIIGDKGSLLSGGQQQRLSIARALLKNAPILLLDEATSALDSESEQQIQNALATLATGRTVIAIAHRLSTILNADQIVVMSRGEIVEVGTHHELYDQCGVYRQLYDIQFQHGQDKTPEPFMPIVVGAN